MFAALSFLISLAALALLGGAFLELRSIREVLERIERQGEAAKRPQT
jgi:hypothetical protein